MNAVEATIPYEGRDLLDREAVLRRDRQYWQLRRMQDVILSVSALLVLWPGMLIVALIIVIDSPGASPVFCQTRIGRDGKPFTFYKFRSMHPNAEQELDQLLPQNEMDGPVFKMKNDPRITRFGRFIRRCSIDELPQLWNVLRGDMSLVGPRPGIPREVEQYDAYVQERLENTGRVVGAYDIDLDKGRFHALHIMDGWKCFRIQDVSSAAYFAMKKNGVHQEERWKVFLDRLDGKQITQDADLGNQTPWEEDAAQSEELKAGQPHLEMRM